MVARYGDRGGKGDTNASAVFDNLLKFAILDYEGRGMATPKPKHPHPPQVKRLDSETSIFSGRFAAVLLVWWRIQHHTNREPSNRSEKVGVFLFIRRML